LKEKKRVKGHVALHMIKEGKGHLALSNEEKKKIIIIRGNASFSLRTERRKERERKDGETFLIFTIYEDLTV
jgi:hypothetical protein